MDKKHSLKRGVIPGRTTQSVSLDDGYSWRKYGQKDIPGAKFPRGYYRCTHRNVQCCLAKKQVQSDDWQPFLYHITYRGHHTCTQTSIVTNSSMNNQVDFRTQSGVDDDDIHYHPALWPSSSRIVTDQKQIGSSRRSDTCTEASCVTSSTLTDSINQTGKSASNADLELSSADFWNEPSVNGTYDFSSETDLEFPFEPFAP